MTPLGPDAPISIAVAIREQAAWLTRCKRGWPGGLAIHRRKEVRLIVKRNRAVAVAIASTRHHLTLVRHAVLRVAVQGVTP